MHTLFGNSEAARSASAGPSGPDVNRSPDMPPSETQVPKKALFKTAGSFSEPMFPVYELYLMIAQIVNTSKS